MCGIFGFVIPEKSTFTPHSTKAILDELFILSETRGKESAGLHFHLPELRHSHTLKGSTRASALIETKAYADLCNRDISRARSAPDETGRTPLIAIAHSRLVTNGAAERDENNQPVSRLGATIVHNGIVVNVDDIWQAHRQLQRSAEVDTEILSARLGQLSKAGIGPDVATQTIFAELKGSASIAWVHEAGDWLILASNTGDIYTYADPANQYVVFASERFILSRILKNMGCSPERQADIAWLGPRRGLKVSANGEMSPFALSAAATSDPPLAMAADVARSAPNATPAGPHVLCAPADERLLRYDEDRLKSLRRCSCCILPETFPFIAFDHDGNCNYCRNYRPRYKDRLPLDAKLRFIERLARYRRNDGTPDCLVAFSGGRDSSYGLHLIKKEFNLTPATFTYDWGMVTDLARRNIARICGELGIQNILVSADINVKRDNIRKNVAAWLKKPDLGIVPLFMAGDKHFFRVVNHLKRQTGIKLDLWCANPLENTDFKTGFCGVEPDFEKSRVDFLSLGRKLRMSAYYADRFVENPSYLNGSLFDTMGAFAAYYIEPRRDFFFIFDHFVWEEREVESTLLSQYDWEMAPDTKSTWRIGDGTAPFYNYIYITARGFSEFDTFRSNQIREGMISREAALASVLVENRPRPQSISWYLDTIKLDFDTTIRRINELDTMGLHR